ncbi:MAG: hypothetical protein KIT69_19280 [Propionibacteriaceae bacterium]|nr:hypothetical protein [Propionibacteriaceae bacterium]
MGRCRHWTGGARQIGWAAVAALVVLLPGNLRAQEDPAPALDERGSDTLGTPEPKEEGVAKGPNHGRLSFGLTNDFTTAYFFRGILQERNGFIWQPSAQLNFHLWEGDAPLRSATLGMGIWNSFQTEKTGATGGPTNLYETDYYPSLTLGWQGGIETSVTYNVYTSPNGAFSTTQEVAVGLAYDDSELLGPFALGPTAIFAFETDNTSFGTTKGGYGEFAVEPGLEVTVPMLDPEKYPVTLSVPLAVGISLYDYYNDGVDDPIWGFFSFGLAATMPLAFIPEDFGAWSVGAGIRVLVLNDTLKAINSNDNPFPVGTLSLAMEY